jgi:hypothetical protein
VQAAKAECGLEDYPQYRGIQAQTSEFRQQNSYFANRSLDQFEIEKDEENNNEA